MKRCKRCGCLLDDDHEGDICECCYDDFLDSDYEYYEDEETEDEDED